MEQFSEKSHRVIDDIIGICCGYKFVNCNHNATLNIMHMVNYDYICIIDTIYVHLCTFALVINRALL